MQVFTFITLTNSTSSHSIDITHFRRKFQSFWTPEGVKIVIFKKSLKTLLDGYKNMIFANFQLSNPYRFQIITWNWFSAKIRRFWTPKGVKNENFEKSWKVPLDNHLNNICTNFQLSNPYLFRKITLGRHFQFRILTVLDP